MKSIIAKEYRIYTQGRPKVSGSIPKVKFDNTHFSNLLNNKNTNLPKFTGKSHRIGGFYSTVLSALSSVENDLRSDIYGDLIRLLRDTPENEIEQALNKLKSLHQNFSLFDYIESTKNSKEYASSSTKISASVTYETRVKALNEVVEDFASILENKDYLVRSSSPKNIQKRIQQPFISEAERKRILREMEEEKWERENIVNDGYGYAFDKENRESQYASKRYNSEQNSGYEIYSDFESYHDYILKDF